MTSLVCSSNNALFVDGYSNESLNINPLGKSYIDVRNNGDFLAKYNSDGILLDYVPLQGSDILNPGYVGTLNLEYNADELTLTGVSYGTPDFDKTSNIVRGVTTAPDFVVRYDENLNYKDHFFFSGFKDGFNGWITAKRIDNSKMALSFGATGFILENGEVDCTPVYTGLSWKYVLAVLSDQTNGINIEKKQDLISVFPNPANDKVNIELAQSNNENYHIEAYNESGLMIFQIEESSSNGILTFDISKYPSGIYMLRIESKTNTECVKVVKK